jgi:hypothetical protein
MCRFEMNSKNFTLKTKYKIKKSKISWNYYLIHLILCFLNLFAYLSN